MTGKRRGGRKGRGGRGPSTGRARWRNNAAAAEEASHKWVVIGAKVEVRSDEDGFVGAWFAAEVVHLESPSSCVVEYEQLLADDDASSPLQELVSLHNLRPRPPALPACRTWLRGHLVEAYDRDGWWTGVVVHSLPELDLVLVRFRTTGEELSFCPSLLRGLQNWDNGKWTDLTQVGRPDKYQAADAVDANGSLSPPRMTEMRKRSRARQSTQLNTDLPSLLPKEVSPAMDTEQLDDVESIPESPVKDFKLCKKFNGYEYYDVEKSQVLRTNGYLATTGELWSHQSELQKSKIRLELVAYQLLVEALRLKGPLKWDHELLLSDVRLHLNITSEEQTFVLNGFMPSKDGRQ